ncbi:MAG: hypothetical protein ACYDCL_13360 [Myxococcales bacterium]
MDHPSGTAEPESVINLTGEFDAPAFCRVRDYLCATAESSRIVLDFHDVRWCHPFALAELFELLPHCAGRVRTRALSRQNDILLHYLGGGRNAEPAAALTH